MMKYIKLALVNVVCTVRTVFFWVSFKLEDVAWFLDRIVVKLNPDKAFAAAYTDTTICCRGPKSVSEKCEPGGCGNCDCEK